MGLGQSPDLFLLFLNVSSESLKVSLELLPLPGLSVDAGLGSLGLRLRLDAGMIGKVADLGIPLSQFVLELGVSVGLGVDLRLKLDLGSRLVEGRDSGLEQTAINRRG